MLRRSLRVGAPRLRHTQRPVSMAVLRVHAAPLQATLLPMPTSRDMMLGMHQQTRRMGVFSNMKEEITKEMDKNETLKASLEELEKSKQEMEQKAKRAMEEVSSRTSAAAKNMQDRASAASQKLKESMDTRKEGAGADGPVEHEEGVEKETKGNGKGDPEAASEEAKQQGGMEGAMVFTRKMFARVVEQKNKMLNPVTQEKWRKEWRLAVKELFGSHDVKSVDEALSSVHVPGMHTPKADTDEEEREEEEYTGPSALVAVKGDESAWEKIRARFREAPIIQGILDAAKQAARTDAGKKMSKQAKVAKDKITDAREDVLEFWETSQNPWVYRLSSIYDGMFGETPMAIAIKEIRRAEPDFILEEWKEKIERVVLPGVLEAFLVGKSRDLKKWFGEAAYAQLNTSIRERKTEGLVMDPHVLSIDNVEVIQATAEDKQAPIILLRFQAQQINCIRNREGKIVDGAEDEVLAYFYIFAFQRDYDDEQQALRWKIVDIMMQRGGRYY